jgi:serine/threonine protein kinase
MSPPDDGTVGPDGPTEPDDDELPSTSSEGCGAPEGCGTALPRGPDADRLIAQLHLGASSRPGALGRLGHYDILNLVGAGAMGLVLRAFDDQLHRTVAIKVLSSHLITSEQARQRFVREARAAAALNHPNVVTIHAVDDHHGIPYLVMEYVDGISLQQRIARSAPMFTIDILRLSQQIANGLSAAHRNGVIHRDIKPANIMLEDGIERVKITDFGLAKAAMGNSEITSHDKLIGTPSYMSPEQVSSDTLDGRSDLFSLGCAMYAMVAGAPPFRGGNCLAVAHRIRHETPRPLREVHPEIPQFLDAIIMRLLEKDPAARFQTADELATQLTHRLALLNQFDSSYAVRETGTTQLLEVSEPVPPSRKHWMLATLFFIPLLVLLGFSLLNSPGSPPSIVPPRTLLPPPPMDDRPQLTVNRDLDTAADARTIGQALALVQSKFTRILVTDDAVYHEKIAIDRPELEGLSLEATSRAVLDFPDTRIPDQLADTLSLIDVENVPHVTIRGFRLRPSENQHGIRLRGFCPGLEISEIHSEQPPTAIRTFLLGHRGLCGTKEYPIRLHHHVVTCGVGAYFLTADDATPVQFVEIAQNEVFGPRNGGGVLLGLTEESGRNVLSHANIVVTRNSFSDGMSPLSLQLHSPEALQSVLLEKNTWFRQAYLIVARESQLNNLGLSFRSNLILETKAVLFTTNNSVVSPHWFHDNHWAFSPGCNQTEIEKVARLHPAISLQSQVIGHPDYLHPTASALPEIRGEFPGAYERPAEEPFLLE